MNKIVFVIILLFLLINLHDLRNWYYSAIGDEYAFYNFAKAIATGEMSPNIFSQKGVYNVIPTLSSYYQAIVMQILGIDVFGWKASHVLLISSTIFGIYLLTKKLFNQKVAILTSWFYSSNFLIWGYVHTGYSNIEALFPFVFSLATFAYKKFFLSGFFAALGFYTFHTSRVTIFVILTLIILSYRNSKLIRTSRNMLFGFAFLIIPFMVTNKDFLIQDMFLRSIVAQNDPSAYGPAYKFVFDNIIRNTLAPFYNNHNAPYISGPILDYVTGIFLAIGTIQLIRKRADIPLTVLYILTIYTIPFIAVAVFSPYGYTVLSRLHILIPAYSILAGFGASEFFRLIKPKRIQLFTIFFVCIFTILLNMYAFFIKTPKAVAGTIESITIKALTDSCKSSMSPTIVGNVKPLLTPALVAYNLQPLLIENKDGFTFDLQNTDCLILMQPDGEQLDYYNKQANNFNYLYSEVADNTGTRKVILFTK